MPERVHTLDLPLLLTGVPAVVREALRLAGVPHAPFRLGAPPGGTTEAGRIVLYDSRSVASRCDAEAARAHGLKAIDVLSLIADASGTRPAWSRFVSGPRGSESTRERFFLRLKRAIESCGGVWARLADYPFPWQCAACSGEGRFLPEFAPLAGLFASLPPEASRRKVEGWLAARYSRRLPLATSDGEPAEFPPDVFRASKFPLLWRTSFADFARWWRVRDRLSLRVRHENETYHVSCGGECDGFTPVLEIWRGDHLAAIPLSEGGSAIRRGGLAFQLEPRRPPAGFTSQWADERPDSAAALHEPQSA